MTTEVLPNSILIISIQYSAVGMRHRRWLWMRWSPSNGSDGENKTLQDNSQSFGAS